MDATFNRLDGKIVGNSGIKTNTTMALLTPGATVDYPRNDKRVALIVSNIGDTTGVSGGVLQVKCYPDDDANNGLTGSNGLMLGFQGTMQFDKDFPWIGIIRIVGLLANTYVCIQELYDGG